MCGICGIVTADQTKPVDGGMLRAMVRVLEHRGPDAESVFAGLGVGLGHQRLEVIDKEGGSQPMHIKEHGLIIVYNGEIYNFRELRQSLESHGELFSTKSDTEVLLRGYAKWGPEVLHRLSGMFAFAIWDTNKRKLFVARDRLGVKPLYWTSFDNGDFAFGSELSSLKAMGRLDDGLNQKALMKYIALGYIIGSQSISPGVQRLEPGTCMEWEPSKGAHVWRYWDLAAIWRNNHEQNLSHSTTFDAIKGEFGDLLEQAVKRRLVSDVPLGSFLSGGLDSSIITSIMQLHMKDVRTFSVGFSQQSYDEAPYAQQVASYLGTCHTEKTMDDCPPELLLEIASGLDEPFADTSIVPTYLLSRMTREHVTVALSGDGGDELLAGYITHQANDYYRYVNRMPGILVKGMRTMVNLIPDSGRKVNTIFKIKKFLAAWPLGKSDAHASWRMLIDPNDIPMENTSVADIFEDFRRASAEVSGLNFLDKSLYVDYKTWLVDDILFKVDRASMSHGLEVRSPFLDHSLVEFCTRLQPALKKNRREGKILLKKYADGRLPRNIIYRKKSGFNSPVSHWLNTSWRELAEEMFRPPVITSVGVDPVLVLRLWREHKVGVADHGHSLFSFLMLLLWKVGGSS